MAMHRYVLEAHRGCTGLCCVIPMKMPIGCAMSSRATLKEALGPLGLIAVCSQGMPMHRLGQGKPGGAGAATEHEEPG